MLCFHRWLKEHAATTIPPMSRLVTDSLTITESRGGTATWIRERMR